MSQNKGNNKKIKILEGKANKNQWGWNKPSQYSTPEAKLKRSKQTTKHISSVDDEMLLMGQIQWSLRINNWIYPCGGH